jgi:hypothetical protein
MTAPRKPQTNSAAGFQQTVVNKAHRSFYDHEEVRNRLATLLKSDTPLNIHRLHSALVVAGVDDRLDRTRVVNYLCNSARFREELEKREKDEPS